MIDGGTIKYFRDRRFRRGIKSWNEIIERTPISTRGHVFSSYIKILSSDAALTKEENAINEEQEEPPLYLSGAPKARLFTSAISSSRKQRICIKP